MIDLGFIKNTTDKGVAIISGVRELFVNGLSKLNLPGLDIYATIVLIGAFVASFYLMKKFTISIFSKLSTALLFLLIALLIYLTAVYV